LKYSRSLLLHQDKPGFGTIFKLLFILPAALLVGSLYLHTTEDISGSIALLAEAILIGLVFWFILPREYRVYEDHIRIVLGGPFSVKIGFQNIKLIRITGRTGMTVNFTTRLTTKYVEIVKRKGFNIALTPSDYDLFLTNATQAFFEWQKTNRELN